MSNERKSGLVTRLAVLVLVVQGCATSDPDQVAAVPASGTVTYKGQPVASGEIQFVPEKGRPAVGKIESGRFRMTTYSDGDGAIPGKAAVSVISTQEVPSKKGGDPEIKYLVPERYASTSNSGILVEIPPAGNDSIKIDIP